MAQSESMYQSSKKFLKDTIHKQLDNALSVAESAVDHFLPDVKGAHPKREQQQPPSSTAHTAAHHEKSHSPEVNLGRVQKIGSRVQNRIHKNAVHRWNAVYLKSEESIKGLEASASIVASAQSHIAAQTVVLKHSLSQMQLYIETKVIDLTHTIQQQANDALRSIAQAVQGIQKDIMETLKKAVDAISKSATSMPSYAQTKIKEFILSLPQRWAAISGSANALPQDEQRFLNHGHQVVRFADESSTMLKSIIEIFSQYIEKAKSLLQNFKVTSAPSSPSSDTSMSVPSTPEDSKMLTSPPRSPVSIHLE